MKGWVFSEVILHLAATIAAVEPNSVSNFWTME